MHNLLIIIALSVAIIAPSSYAAPSLFEPPVPYIKVKCVSQGVFSYNKRCDVFLSDEIGSPAKYQDLEVITHLDSADTVVMHVVGDGGDAAGLLYILNMMNKSKAHVITSVEGNVASAHAVIAMAGDTIDLSNEAYLYFHSVSTTNMADDLCKQFEGQKDRGLPMDSKCREILAFTTPFYNVIMERYVKKVLTEEELKRYYEGHDILLSNEEVARRLNKSA